jgi:glutathione S-transferase
MSKRNNKTVSPPTQDNAFLPTEPRQRAECLSWVFWMQGSAPYVGGGFGHFYAYAPEKFEYPLNRFTMETKRLLSVLDRHLGGASKVRCGKRKRRQNASKRVFFGCELYHESHSLIYL